jgi:hypothetical protein
VSTTHLEVSKQHQKVWFKRKYRAFLGINLCIINGLRMSEHTNHSYFRLSTGLAWAALKVWEVTVTNATTSVIRAVKIKMSGPMVMG